MRADSSLVAALAQNSQLAGQYRMKLNGTSPRQIRAARILLGWSQAELASRSGLSTTVITRMEAGTVDARLRTIEAILKAFGEQGVEFIGEADGSVGVVHRPRSQSGGQN